MSRKISGSGFRIPHSSEKVSTENGARSPERSSTAFSTRPGVRIVLDTTASANPRRASAAMAAGAPPSAAGGTRSAGHA